MDKENISPTPQSIISKRKSYSILSPIKISNKPTTPTKAKQVQGDNGIAQFSLSPRGKKDQENKPMMMIVEHSSQKTGLPIFIPIEQKQEVEDTDTKEQLLREFASKHRRLDELRKEADQVKQEISDLSRRLQQSIQDTNSEMTDAKPMTRKPSKLFQLGQKMASMKQNIDFNSPVKKKDTQSATQSLKSANSISNFTNYLSQVQGQISPQLTNPKIKSVIKDIKSKMENNDNQAFRKFIQIHSNEVDEIANKTSQFVSALFSNPKKSEIQKTDVDLNSTFNFENLTVTEENESSLLFGSESEESSYIGIDEINSSCESI